MSFERQAVRAKQSIEKSAVSAVPSTIRTEHPVGDLAVIELGCGLASTVHVSCCVVAQKARQAGSGAAASNPVAELTFTEVVPPLDEPVVETEVPAASAEELDGTAIPVVPMLSFDPVSPVLPSKPVVPELDELAASLPVEPVTELFAIPSLASELSDIPHEGASTNPAKPKLKAINMLRSRIIVSSGFLPLTISHDTLTGRVKRTAPGRDDHCVVQPQLGKLHREGHADAHLTRKQSHADGR